MYDESCNCSIVIALNGFDEDALRFNAPSVNIVKFDGECLAKLIVDSGIGVATKTTVEFHPENILL